MKEELPEFLYKYCKYNEYFVAMMRNKRLWFSNPASFNDPFDGSIYIPERVDVPQMKEYFLKRDSKNASFFEEKKDDTLAVLILRDEYMGILQTELDKLRIFCLSEEPNNLLMWAHYADCHKGICIKFRTSELLKSFAHIYKVTYSEQKPQIDAYFEVGKAFEIAHTNKAIDWKYEKEYRIVGSRSAFEFLPSSIEEIAFGAKFDPANERMRFLGSLRDIDFGHVKLLGKKISRSSYKVVTNAIWKWEKRN
ncbi:MAG TPA: DUF2971 domain-containing protein [Mucilaginibacter sp.]